MIRLRALRAVALSFACVLAAPLVAGCAADEAAPGDQAPAGDDVTGGSEDEVRSTLLGNVAAIKINGGATIAAPAKLRRVLENIGLQPGADRPAEGAFRCMSSYRLEILDAKGETKATAGFLCGGAGSASRKNAKGSVSIGGKSYLIDAKDVDAIDAVGKEPLAIADVLYGVDRIEIVKPGASAATIGSRDGAIVSRIVKAMRPDQVPNPNAAFPRCLPSRSVGFFKGTKEIASVSLSCGEGARGYVQGNFSARVGESRGAADINAGTVFDVEAELTRR